MYNNAASDPRLGLPAPAYYQLVHTLTRGLPPPLADTPEALLARNQAAIEKVAALLPVNANEADLAAQCVAARAQAEDVMRLLRVHAGDIRLVMKLNAQYVAMVRTSLSAHGHLLRTQALRHKREAIDATREADEWTRHVAASSMQQVLDAGPLPEAVHAPPAPAPTAAPPPRPAEQAAPPHDPPPGFGPCTITITRRPRQVRRYDAPPPDREDEPPDDDLCDLGDLDADAA